MLQQTQVATVIEYYHRFLEAYPDVQSLAEADEQDVLRLWSGLGYYRRARQLHAAAKQIADTGGDFPSTLETIELLPGIGRYTAGAIASFAFDLPAPIVEANTQRLYSRLLRLQSDPRSREGQSQLWAFAEALVDQSKDCPGRINQAVMEIGSQICTPRDPDCAHCPLRDLCPTFADGLQTSIPMMPPKKAITELTHVAVLVRSCDKLLMSQNPKDQWWTGLWDFPRIDVTQVAGFQGNSNAPPSISTTDLDWLSKQLHQQYAIDCTVDAHVCTFKHAVTRYRITLHAFTARIGVRPGRSSVLAWHDLEAALELPLTAPAKKILKGLR